MGSGLHHWLSFAAAFAFGAWVAVREPDQRLFERAMRSLDLTGPILGPLDAVSSVAATFVAMLAAYAAAYAVLLLVRSGLERRETAAKRRQASGS